MEFQITITDVFRDFVCGTYDTEVMGALTFEILRTVENRELKIGDTLKVTLEVL